VKKMGFLHFWSFSNTFSDCDIFLMIGLSPGFIRKKN
jgi:hypothetical protein